MDQVIVHPMVIHYKGVNEELETQESHGTMRGNGAKCCIIKAIIVWIKQISIRTAQSSILCKLYNIVFDISASWQYMCTSKEGMLIKGPYDRR